MKYHSLIRKIKHLAQAHEDESQDALEVVVENIAIHLDDVSRRDFASRLPEELRTAAMMVPTASIMDDDIIEQFLDIEDVDEGRARQFIQAAWEALSELFDTDALKDIVRQLPRRTALALGS